MAKWKTKFGHFLYCWELNQKPNKIPYEHLSKLVTWKLQKQIEYDNLTFKKWFWSNKKTFFAYKFAAAFIVYAVLSAMKGIYNEQRGL